MKPGETFPRGTFVLMQNSGIVKQQLNAQNATTILLFPTAQSPADCLDR